MSLNVQCEQCGAENPADRIFCRSCGGRLSLDEQHMQSSEHTHRLRKRVGRLIALLILLVLAAAVGLVLWPVEPGGSLGRPVDVAACVDAMKRLEWADENGRDRAERFTEPMVNGYLEAARRTAQEKAGEDGPVSIEVVRVGIEENRLRLWVQVRRGSFLQTVAAVLSPAVGEEGLVFVVDRFELGHLPFPPFLKGVILGPLERLFEERTRERALFASIDRVKVQDAEMWLAVTRRQAPSDKETP